MIFLHRKKTDISTGTLFESEPHQQIVGTEKNYEPGGTLFESDNEPHQPTLCTEKNL